MTKNKKTKWHCEVCGHMEINRKQTYDCLCPKCGSWLWFSEVDL